jgi:hypothetical protein
MKLKDLEHSIAIKNDRIERYDSEVSLLRRKIEEKNVPSQDRKVEE